MKTATTLGHDEAWLLLALARQRAAAGARARAGRGTTAGSCAACAREAATQRHMVPAAHRPGARDLRARPLVAQAHGAHRRPGRRASATRARRRARCRARGAAPSRDLAPAGTRLGGDLRAHGGTRAAHRDQLSLVAAAVLPTPPRARRPGVLHIAFDRALPVGDVAESCVPPARAWSKDRARAASSGSRRCLPLIRGARGTRRERRMRALAARLQADPRVRWIEPLAAP